MFKQSVLDAVSKYFPNVKVAYKDQSTFMKILGTLMFFNPAFMKSFATTIGDTIYYPSTNYVNAHPVSSFIILLHELIHITDEQRISKPFFSFLYLLPQLLFLPALLLFLISWKIAIPIAILFLLPLPAYFRMQFEKKAYFSSLYTMHQLNIKSQYNIDLNVQKETFVGSLKGLSYYCAWPFGNLDTDFDAALKKILNGERPYDDKVFDILDEIIAAF